MTSLQKMDQGQRDQSTRRSGNAELGLGTQEWPEAEETQQEPERVNGRERQTLLRQASKRRHAEALSC